MGQSSFGNNACRHAHLLTHSLTPGMNFTHRIDRFSYADEEIGAQTLDGDIKIAYDGMYVCMYVNLIVSCDGGNITYDRYTHSLVSIGDVQLLPHCESCMHVKPIIKISNRNFTRVIQLLQYTQCKQIVPTKAKKAGAKVAFISNQYSVSEMYTDLDASGRAGIPGMVWCGVVWYVSSSSRS